MKHIIIIAVAFLIALTMAANNDNIPFAVEVKTEDLSRVYSWLKDIKHETHKIFNILDATGLVRLLGAHKASMDLDIVANKLSDQVNKFAAYNGDMDKLHKALDPISKMAQERNEYFAIKAKLEKEEFHLKLANRKITDEQTYQNYLKLNNPNSSYGEWILIFGLGAFMGGMVGISVYPPPPSKSHL